MWGWKVRQEGRKTGGKTDEIKGGWSDWGHLENSRESSQRAKDLRKTEGGCFCKVESRTASKTKRLDLVTKRALVALKAVSETWWSLKSVGMGWRSNF